MNDKKFMRHEKDEVLTALTKIDSFSDDKDYKANLKIIYEYIEDVVNLMEKYRQMADFALKAFKVAPQDHKQK